MRSYMNLAVLALAASTVSPAFSAPTPPTRVGPPLDPIQEEDRETPPAAAAPGYPPAPAPAPAPEPEPATAPAPPAANQWKKIVALGLPPTIVAAILVGLGYKYHIYSHRDTSSLNHKRRTSEAFEGRANAELLERALGDHDLDKRLGLSAFFLRTLGTRAGSSATPAGVSKDNSHRREVIAALRALGKRDVAPEDKIEALHLFSRLLDGLD